MGRNGSGSLEFVTSVGLLGRVGHAPAGAVGLAVSVGGVETGGGVFTMVVVVDEGGGGGGGGGGGADPGWHCE